jgi:hypothetical protein
MLGLPLLKFFAAAFLVMLTPQVRSGSIEGVVVRAGTSEPIAKAIVEIDVGRLVLVMSPSIDIAGQVK